MEFNCNLADFETDSTSNVIWSAYIEKMFTPISFLLIAPNIQVYFILQVIGVCNDIVPWSIALFLVFYYSNKLFHIISFDNFISAELRKREWG